MQFEDGPRVVIGKTHVAMGCLRNANGRRDTHDTFQARARHQVDATSEGIAGAIGQERNNAAPVLPIAMIGDEQAFLLTRR